MISQIIRKEAKEMIRDGRFRVAGLIVLVLLSVSIVTGWRQYAEFDRQRNIAQESQRKFWVEQGEKNAHSAAHYGIYAFKPQLPLGAVDSGLDPYLGVSQFLEAHKQNAAQFRPAEDATPLSRFGALTAAVTLQILLPLLIILLGYNLFTAERENGTLRQLLSVGVDRTRLAMGKALGVGLVLMLLVVPACVLGAIGIAANSGTAEIAMSLPRIGLTALVYLLYFLVVIGLTIIVSARSSSSRVALVVLLGFWFVNCLVASRVVTDIARSAHPTPTATALAKAIDTENAGHGKWDERVKARTAELMAQYNVTDKKDLSVNPEAIVLDEGEQTDTEASEKHFAKLYDTYAAQARVYQLGGAVAPLLAVQSLSMGTAGTDLSHHRHFTNATEQYRRDLVNILNQDLISKGNVEAIWDVKSGSELWEKVPAFSYLSPGVGWVIEHHWIAFLVLCLWSAGVIIAIPFAVRGMKID